MGRIGVDVAWRITSVKTLCVTGSTILDIDGFIAASRSYPLLVPSDRLHCTGRTSLKL